MIRAAWAISIALVLLGAANADAQGGKLQSVRDDVRSPSSTDSGSSSGRPADDNDSLLGAFLAGLFTAQDDDGNFVGGLVLVYTVIAPFYLPAAMLGDNYRQSLSFVPHPYANGYRGYQILPLELADQFYETETGSVRRKTWAVRLAIENGNDFSGLNRFAGQVKVEHASRWGFVTNWNYFYERLSCGCVDETVIGDANVTFRFAQNEIASMYTGLGFRVLTDRRQTDFGFNFTYGGDWFPMRPFVVSGVFDAGNLGNAGVIHARGSVGAIWHGCEIFTGYDFLRIGSANLQGPMAGVRFWF